MLFNLGLVVLAVSQIFAMVVDQQPLENSIQNSFFEAVKIGQIETVNALIEKGANVNQKDEYVALFRLK